MLRDAVDHPSVELLPRCAEIEGELEGLADVRLVDLLTLAVSCLGNQRLAPPLHRYGAHGRVEDGDRHLDQVLLDDHGHGVADHGEGRTGYDHRDLRPALLVVDPLDRVLLGHLDGDRPPLLRQLRRAGPFGVPGERYRMESDPADGLVVPVDVQLLEQDGIRPRIRPLHVQVVAAEPRLGEIASERVSIRHGDEPRGLRMQPQPLPRLDGAVDRELQLHDVEPVDGRVDVAVADRPVRHPVAFDGPAALPVVAPRLEREPVLRDVIEHEIGAVRDGRPAGIDDLPSDGLFDDDLVHEGLPHGLQRQDAVRRHADRLSPV